MSCPSSLRPYLLRQRCRADIITRTTQVKKEKSSFFFPFPSPPFLLISTLRCHTLTLTPHPGSQDFIHTHPLHPQSIYVVPPDLTLRESTLTPPTFCPLSQSTPPYRRSPSLRQPSFTSLSLLPSLPPQTTPPPRISHTPFPTPKPPCHGSGGRGTAKKATKRLQRLGRRASRRRCVTVERWRRRARPHMCRLARAS